MNLTEELSIGATPIYNGLNVSLSSTIDKTISIFTIIILFITMISLGCTMDVFKIKTHILQPKGVVIGLLAQFGIMPLAAFCLTKMLQLEPIKAVTVLICGCCPGGNLSNVFSLALNGDMNLSILMTTCSSIVALGMMPLLLFLFCQGFTGLENAVPYTSIITALILSLVPCGIGITINHYRPKYSPVVMKVGLIILLISAVIIGVLSHIALGSAILIIFTPELLTVAVLMPLTGYMLGYFMSTVCKLNHQCSRTISMETGCQNIQLCGTILKVAFPLHVIGPMFLFPLLYIISQCTVALLLIFCFRCYQAFKPSAEEKTVYQAVDRKQEEVKQP
ncbi:hypothetical protein LDENG_00064580 [Lucifuga dentata]|nr:hypothetical protein LDENG_00064580 [Lucifuga dentata]